MARAHSENARIKVEVFIFNPLDSLHTENGYNPIADVTRVLDPAHQQLEHHDDDDGDHEHKDLEVEIPLRNTDRVVTLVVPAEDIIDPANPSPISIRLKIRATEDRAFDLQLDQLIFTASSFTPPDQAVRQGTQQYIDPGLKNPFLATVESDRGYALVVDNVHPGVINVNWAWRTPDLLPGETCILVFRGLVVAHGAVLPPGKINTPPHVHSDDDEDHEDDEHDEHHVHHVHHVHPEECEHDEHHDHHEHHEHHHDDDEYFDSDCVVRGLTNRGGSRRTVRAYRFCGCRVGPVHHRVFQRVTRAGEHRALCRIGG